ncbi:MAG TPA: hypothetical protein VI876_09840 [Dehalococcoidia bacterium]|nr:hypothetical protein [Dehalococcoidia bacterium]
MAERITVATQQGLVFNFDGEVLEVFSYDDSRRIHLRQIRSIEMGRGFLGGSMFSVALKAGQTYALQVKLDDAEAVQLQELADAVTAALVS